MANKITIEYCIAWGYLPKAVSLAEKILRTYKHNLAGLELIPSGGGVFEVKLNDDLLFSKKKLGRFPQDNEVEDMVKAEITK